MAQQAIPILEVTPDREIAFPGRAQDFQEPKIQYLKLKNISRENVAFKVKTTALRSYLVKPSSSVLTPGQDMDVQIALQRLAEIPANGSHRFLVQALTTQEAKVDKNSWTTLAKTTPTHEFKLAVTFPDVNSAPVSLDLQSKYEELGVYTQKLQEQKARWAEEIQKLQEPKPKKYGMLHIIIAVILGLFMLKVFERVQKM